MRPRAATLLLKQCLGHREGEPVLIVCDAPFLSAARALQEHALEMKIEATLLAMGPRHAPGEEPPPTVVEALKGSPVAVVLTSRALGAARAFREARERGGRIAFLPGADIARLEGLLDIDTAELGARVGELARQFEGGRRVRVTSAAGTDLSFDIAGRPVRCETGDLTRPGSGEDLPAGGIRLAPVEGTAEGVLTVDGAIEGLGLLQEPVTLRFSAGRAVEISDPRLADLLRSHGPEAEGLGEFGIGANPRAAITGNALEDERALGVAHVALGGNRDLGGRVDLAVRVGAALRAAAVEVDGRPVPAKFLTPVPAPLAPDLGAIQVGTVETYRHLFESSNDPLYVLDLETQRFLEVNPGFERLTGYTRAELLSGRTTAPKLVARESMPIFQRKRETRRQTPAERYDLKVQTRSGEKRPVELSVRKITLGGRDVVVGAVRDLTQRKKLEQEMWDKIEELGYANNRIYALTEKIRRVPELTPQLLNITDEEELLERTARLLCAREGLDYADVNFYLLRDEHLELAYSTVKIKKRRMRLTSDHRLVRVLKGEEAGGMSSRDLVLPLKAREQNIGVMEVFFHPKEIHVLEENERALKGYRDLLETLSNIIGLLVDNLHLYEIVKRQAIVDPLTGVYNRRYLDSKIAEEINRASRYGRDLTLLMIDVDKFAQINNAMGHKQGDLTLIELARLFRAHTREADTVCRYGGDEFAILLPETNYERALLKAESLRQVVRSNEFSNTLEPAHSLQVTLSIGVTSHRASIRNADEFLRAADEAMYAAKRSGRDTVSGTYRSVKSATEA